MVYLLNIVTASALLVGGGATHTDGSRASRDEVSGRVERAANGTGGAEAPRVEKPRGGAWLSRWAGGAREADDAPGTWAPGAEITDMEAKQEAIAGMLRAVTAPPPANDPWR